MDAAEEDRQYGIGLNRLFYVYSRDRFISPVARVAQCHSFEKEAEYFKTEQ